MKMPSPTNPYDSSELTAAESKQEIRMSCMFHAIGICFVILALLSWILIWDFLRPEMKGSDSAYQLKVLFLMAVLAFLPLIGFVFFYRTKFFEMRLFSKILFGAYVLPLTFSWLVAIGIYRLRS